MKLVIGGATGFCGKETVKQALQTPEVTSVVTITRKPLDKPEGPGSDKQIDNIVLADFQHYPDSAKHHLADADALIWTIAITPTKSKEHDWEHVKTVCRDYAMAALHTAVEARTVSTPLRFVYYSGVAAERDQTKTPAFMPEMLLLRGRIENEILAYAAEHSSKVQVCIIKPGKILEPGTSRPDDLPAHVPCVKVEECVGTTLKQALVGIDGDTLLNNDLVKIGHEYLSQTGKAA